MIIFKVHSVFFVLTLLLFSIGTNSEAQVSKVSTLRELEIQEPSVFSAIEAALAVSDVGEKPIISAPFIASGTIVPIEQTELSLERFSKLCDAFIGKNAVYDKGQSGQEFFDVTAQSIADGSSVVCDAILTPFHPSHDEISIFPAIANLRFDEQILKSMRGRKNPIYKLRFTFDSNGGLQWVRVYKRAKWPFRFLLSGGTPKGEKPSTLWLVYHFGIQRAVYLK